MGRIYKTYTEIKFQHNYYASKVCPDLDILPTTETARLLSKYRLMWGPQNKLRPNIYQLLREHIDDPTPLLPLPAAYCLRFAMFLRNDEIVNYTQGLSRVSKEIFFFENQADNVSIMGPAYRKMELVPGMATVTALPAGQNVTVTPADGSAPWVVDGVDENGQRFARVSFERKPVGIYLLSWTGGSKEVYNDAALAGQDLFGVMHLTTNSTVSIANRLGFVLTFVPKTVKWKYFVILKKAPHTGSTYGIFNRNAAANGAFTFANYPQASWDPVLDPKPADLLAMNPGSSILAFISSTNIPYRDVARSSIKLERAGSFARVVVNDLPNPAIGSANPAVFVMVDNPTP
jgi:hypothetical protein